MLPAQFGPLKNPGLSGCGSLPKIEEITVDKEEFLRFAARFHNSPELSGPIDPDVIRPGHIVAARSLFTGQIVASAPSEPELISALAASGFSTAEVLIFGLNSHGANPPVWPIERNNDDKPVSEFGRFE
jgi:hypothetical protein